MSRDELTAAEEAALILRANLPAEYISTPERDRQTIARMYRQLHGKDVLTPPEDPGEYYILEPGTDALDLLLAHERERLQAKPIDLPSYGAGDPGRVLRKQAGAVRQAESGERHDVLLRAASIVARSGTETRDAAWRELRTAALAAGMNESEASAAFLCGWKRWLA